MRERTEVVRDLVQFRADPSVLLAELRRFGWDLDQPLVEVTAKDVRRMLGGLMHGELGASKVKEWAEAIEVRDDLSFASPEVRQAVHVLANPDLEGALTSETVRGLRAGLLPT